MKQLIFLMAMLWMICPDMAQAQTRRPVQRSKATTTQVKKTPSTSKQEEQKQRELQHRLDSVEALYNDLNSRYENDQLLASMTKKDDTGTEYQVARAVLEGSTLTIYLRVRNLNNSPTLLFQNFAKGIGLISSSIKLNNDEKESKATGPYRAYVEKGYWIEVKIGPFYNIKSYPKPKNIKEIKIKEGHNPDTPITFNDIPL